MGTNILDSDGDIFFLVPGWLKSGINVMFPLGVRFDNLAHVQGNKVIDKELERLSPMLEDGGFIPTMDHFVPSEFSYETYKCYLTKKRKWIGRTDAKPLK